jgi:SprT protein
MRKTQVIERRIRAEVLQCMKVGNHYLRSVGKPPIRGVSISFFRRGSAAGYASEGSLEFNTRICEGDVDKFLAETVPHEVAHLFAFRLIDDDHGPVWAALDRMMGGVASRYHDHPIPGDRVYVCACGAAPQLSKWCHNRAQAGHRYWCMACGRQVFPATSLIGRILRVYASTVKRVRQSMPCARAE